MKISLIITSRDKPVELKRFFKSIVDQIHFSGNVVIFFCDQGDNLGIVEEFSGRIEIKYIKINPCGLSAARNLAIRHIIDSDIVAFPDDDCWYPSDFLDRLSKDFVSTPELDVICTRVFDPIRALPYGRRPIDVVKIIDFSNLFRFPISVGIFARLSSLKVSGAFFNENLGAGTAIGSGEETELISRMLEHKLVIKYFGTYDVYHEVPNVAKEDRLKNFQYGIGFGLLVKYLFLRGHWKVLIEFNRVVVGSALGIIWHLFRPHSRGTYAGRLLGVIKGFAFMKANKLKDY